MNNQSDLSSSVSAQTSSWQGTPLDVVFQVLDDWSGIIDPRRRKKIQNRLNQRKHRQRQRYVTEKLESQDQLTASHIRPVAECITDFACLRDLYNLGFYSEQINWIIRQLESIYFNYYTAASPRTELLLGLTQLNLIRALIFNIDILGYTPAHMHNDALSPFCIASSLRVNEETAVLPPSLRPTALQRSTPHHPWLDLFPIPRMRDNLIAIESLGNEYELCEALCSSMDGTSGILVWKDPWDPAGWEVTSRFACTSGSTIEGCWDLFQSTNYWRIKRGEKPLFYNIL